MDNRLSGLCLPRPRGQTGNVAIYSLHLRSVGKTTHAPRTAGAHLRYITRPKARADLLARGSSDGAFLVGGGGGLVLFFFFKQKTAYEITR